MKKRLVYFLLFFLLLFLSRHWLFEKTVTFLPNSEQPIFLVSDDNLHQYLANAKTINDIEGVINEAIDLTAESLSFASKKTDIDPNLSFHGKRAHCVGYAAFFATVSNFLFKKNRLADEWKTKHVRGKIHFLGFDLHQFSNNPFFRDHDFNVVENRQTGQQYFVDASVKDVLGIRYLKKTP